MELSLLTESKSSQLRRGKRLKQLFFLTLFISILFVVCVVLMLALSDWEPGDQEAILRQYKAHPAEFEFPATGELATK